MRLALFIAAIAVVTAVVAGVGAVSAHGNSPAKLTAAGWECFLEEEDQMVICFPLGDDASFASFSALIFDTSDLAATDAPLVGQDLFLRADLYHGQPCRLFGAEDYLPLDFDADGTPDFFVCPHPFGGLP